MAWRLPFEKLDGDEVEARYAPEGFPSLRNIDVGPIMENCWKESYEDADIVVGALREQIYGRVPIL